MAETSSSSPNVSNNPTTTPYPSQIIAINAATQLPLKLSKLNYPSWRVQFLSLLFGYDLESFIDGSSACPPRLIIASDSTESLPNPAYRLWKRQDSLIFHAILASISDSIVPLITSADSAATAWSRLEKTFASKSHTRVMGLRESLGTLTTANLSISDYMQKIKSISETLALAGSPMSDDELIHTTLNGLGAEFQSLSSAIRARDTLISFEELHDKLLDFEVAASRTTSPTTTPVTAHFHQRSPQFNKSRQPEFTHQNGGFHRNGHRTQPGYSQPRSSSILGSPPLRRDSPSTQASSGSSNWRSHRPICQLCDKVGHTAKTCRSSSKPQANVSQVSHAPNQQQAWIVDSGASHHITSDLNQLNLHSEYDGNDDIIIGPDHGGAADSRTK